VTRRAVLSILLLAAAAEPAQAGARVLSFSCEIGSGRTRVLVPRAREENSNDELLCRAVVGGIGGRNARDLAVELRLLPPQGDYRVVASSHLEPGERRGRAEIDELAVPHASWATAIDWRRPKTPRVRLLLRVLDRPSPGSTRWRVLATRRLELGGPAPQAAAGRRRPTR
jgi:hypothetical protein